MAISSMLEVLLMLIVAIALLSIGIFLGKLHQSLVDSTIADEHTRRLQNDQQCSNEARQQQQSIQQATVVELQGQQILLNTHKQQELAKQLQKVEIKLKEHWYITEQNSEIFDTKLNDIAGEGLYFIEC